jgi:catechol 2,3-dioxygenase-like lactoylglutathione lyase family enzyme
MPVRVRLGHVAVPAANPPALAGFYRRLLGWEPTMEGAVPGLGAFVFLGESPRAALPLLALHTDPQGRHLALEVESLAALRTLCAEARARGLAPDAALNHHVSLSVYFRDPEGNLVEVYWPTGQTDTSRPYADPFPLADLERPDAELLARLTGPA